VNVIERVVEIIQWEQASMQIIKEIGQGNVDGEIM
jgi:hypothetical protein